MELSVLAGQSLKRAMKFGNRCWHGKCRGVDMKGKTVRFAWTEMSLCRYAGAGRSAEGLRWHENHEINYE